MCDAGKGESVRALKTPLKEYTKGMTDKKRTAATHLMIFMISDEARNTKPYALPVRFMPVRCVTDAKMRLLREELRTEMTKIGMTVVGKF